MASLPFLSANQVPQSPLGNSGCCFHTDLAQCPVVLAVPQPRLGHLPLFLSVSNLGLGHFPPHFALTAHSIPTHWGSKTCDGITFLRLLESTSFQQLCFALRTSPWGLVQGFCLWYGQWLCKKPFLAQLRLVGGKHPARCRWRGERDHACWLRSGCIWLQPSFRLAATGVTDPTCSSPG